MDFGTFENTHRKGHLDLIYFGRDPSFRPFFNPSCQLEVITSCPELQRCGRAALSASIAFLTIPAGEMLRPPLLLDSEIQPRPFFALSLTFSQRLLLPSEIGEPERKTAKLRGKWRNLANNWPEVARRETNLASGEEVAGKSHSK